MIDGFIFFQQFQKTLNKIIHSLEEKDLIKTLVKKGNLKNGGSEPMAYGPVFPENFKVWLKSGDMKNIKDEALDHEIEERTKEQKEIEW